MTDNQIYIDKVVTQFPDVVREIRPAVAIADNDGVDVMRHGFVVGNKYFIDRVNFVISKKSAFFLINYLDEVDE